MMRIQDLQQLGQEIRAQRKALALRQPDAASLAGVSVSLWSDLERGKRENVSLGTVLRILQTLGLDLELRSRRRPAPAIRANAAAAGEGPAGSRKAGE